MKKGKLSFKRIALVASLAVAGLFGISSFALNGFSTKNNTPKEAEAVDYSYIWYYQAAAWSGTSEFDDNVSWYAGKASQYYTLWINGSHNTDKNGFGKSYAARDTYSEIYGPRLVKIYYNPSTTTQIQFCRDWNGSGKENFSDELVLRGNEGKVFLLTDYHWGGSGYQHGQWISFEQLQSEWVRPAYFAITGGWNSGTLTNMWIWSQTNLLKYDGTWQTCEYAAIQTGSHLTTVTRNGTTFIQFYIPRTTSYSEFVKIQIRTESGGSGKKSTSDLSFNDFSYLNNPAFRVTTNNGSSNQTGYWRDVDDTSCNLVTPDGNMLFRKYYNQTESYHWNAGGAKTAVYYWDDSGNNCWSNIATDADKYEDGDGYNDYFVNPTDTSHTWTHCKFVRLNSSCTTPNWGDKWYETDQIDINLSYNCYGPQYNNNASLSYVNKYSITGIKYYMTNDHLYLDLGDYETSWEDSNAIIAAYCYGSNKHVDISTNEMKVVEGFVNEDQSKNTAVYEFIIPDANYTNVIFLRLNPTGQNSPGPSNEWWIKLSDNKYHLVWTQTGDLKRYPNNVFKLSSAAGAGSYEWNESDYARAVCYGRYFNECIVCNGETMTTDKWSDAKTEYEDYICTKIQGLIWLAEAKPSGNALELAMSKYDYIVAKYGESRHPDFIDRKNNEGSALHYLSPNKGFITNLIVQSDDTSMIVIIIASSISILSITALSVLLVKKRKTKEQ